MRILWVLLWVTAALTVAMPPAHAQDLLTSCFNAAREGDDTACSVCERAAAENDGERKGVALLNLARCEENRGDLLSARPHYVSAKALLPDRSADIEALIQGVDKRVATLRLDWSRAPAGTTLTIDGRAIEARREAVPVNPGERVATVAAPGHDDNTMTVTIADGAESLFVVVPKQRSTEAPVAPGPEPPIPDDTDSGQRTAGYVVGAVGVAGVVLFAITGVMALTEQATVDEHCPESGDAPRVCTSELGIEAAERGDTLNIINAVGLGIGVAGLAVGLVLVLTAPDGETNAAIVVGPTRAALRVTF